MNNNTNNDLDVVINRSVTQEITEKRKRIKSAVAKKNADWLGLQQRTAFITIRVTPDLKETIFKAAEQRGLSASEYVTQILETIVAL